MCVCKDCKYCNTCGDEERTVECKGKERKSYSERANMVRSMEMIMRALNNEEVFEAWLMVGVADGDINGKESDEDLEYYCEDKVFADLMATFCRLMQRANTDTEIDKEDRMNGNGILFFDGVVSKADL